MAAPGDDRVFDPASASAEQRFLLMLHERLGALEAARAQQELAQARLAERVAALERLSYDPVTERFSNGDWIDWLVSEPPALLRIGSTRAREPAPPTAAHWDAPVVRREPWLLHMPVEFFGAATRVVTLPEHLTVRKLVGLVHAFYAAPVTEQDVALLREHAQAAVRARMEDATQPRLTRLGLVGGDPDVPREDTRDKAMMVRYEGVGRRSPREPRDMVLVLGDTRSPRFMAAHRNPDGSWHL